MARHASPDQISRAIALRQAGFSLQSISDQVGIPVRTLTDHFARHGTKKGKKAVIEDAEEFRRLLVRAVLADDTIRSAIAIAIADDLAISKALKDRMALLLARLDDFECENLRDIGVVSRSLAALSVVNKNISDGLRRTLTPREAPDETDLPVLTVEMLSNEQIEAMREAQQRAGDFDVPDPLPGSLVGAARAFDDSEMTVTADDVDIGE